MSTLEWIVELCCCGATFETHGWPPYVTARATAWRLEHRHEPPLQGSAKTADAATANRKGTDVAQTDHD